MLIEYFPLILTIVAGFGFAIIFLIAAEWLGARRWTKEKRSVYESGMIPFGTARERFSIKFYMVAVSFLVFDIEVVFLYPWAVQVEGLGTAALLAAFLFIIILFVGYIYEVLKGGLEWD